jgi:hypothetical protein
MFLLIFLHTTIAYEPESSTLRFKSWLYHLLYALRQKLFHPQNEEYEEVVYRICLFGTRQIT